MEKKNFYKNVTHLLPLLTRLGSIAAAIMSAKTERSNTMIIHRQSGNFEELRRDNIIIGFVVGMAIIETEDKKLHYIEGMGPEHGEIGEAVPDGSFKSIRLLPAQEQANILKTLQRG